MKFIVFNVIDILCNRHFYGERSAVNHLRAKMATNSCTCRLYLLMLFCETNESWRACKYLGSQVHDLHTCMHQSILWFCSRNRGQLAVGFYNMFQLILRHPRFCMAFEIFKHDATTLHAFSASEFQVSWRTTLLRYSVRPPCTAGRKFRCYTCGCQYFFARLCFYSVTKFINMIMKLNIAVE